MRLAVVAAAARRRARAARSGSSAASCRGRGLLSTSSARRAAITSRASARMRGGSERQHRRGALRPRASRGGSAPRARRAPPPPAGRRRSPGSPPRRHARTCSRTARWSRRGRRRPRPRCAVGPGVPGRAPPSASGRRRRRRRCRPLRDRVVAAAARERDEDQCERDPHRFEGRRRADRQRRPDGGAGRTPVRISSRARGRRALARRCAPSLGRERRAARPRTQAPDVVSTRVGSRTSYPAGVDVRTGTTPGYARPMPDDDDWVGTPPEGRHSRDRADPGFWATSGSPPPRAPCCSCSS